MYAIYHFTFPDNTSFIEIRKTHYDSRLIHEICKQRDFKKFAKQKSMIKVELIDLLTGLEELPKMERYIKKKMILQECRKKMAIEPINSTRTTREKTPPPRNPTPPRAPLLKPQPIPIFQEKTLTMTF